MGPRDYKPDIASYVCRECNGENGTPCRLTYEKLLDSQNPKYCPLVDATAQWEVENDPTVENCEDT